VLVPSSVLDTMSLGDISGITALTKGLADQMKAASLQKPQTEKEEEGG
jgi:hypothetical protein